MEEQMLKSIGLEIPYGERRMAKLRKKTSLLESIPLLVLLGLLAGAVGGLGIGAFQLHQMSASAASSAGK
jgi:hypothetical protein